MSQQSNGKLRVAIYARVSTRMQAEAGHSVETQERNCRTYCDRAAGVGNYKAEVFADRGRSGEVLIRQIAKPGEKWRPGLSELVERCREFDWVVIDEVDRMAREEFVWYYILYRYLDPLRVSLRIVSGNLNLDNPEHRLIAGIKSNLGKQDLRMLRRRICDAHESRRQAGCYPTSHAPWGWRWQDREKLAPGQWRTIEPHAERLPWVKWMADKLLDEGWGTPRIAKALHRRADQHPELQRHWTASVVRRILIQPIHAGYLPPHAGYKPSDPQPLIQGKHYDQRLYDLDTYTRILDTLHQRHYLPSRTLGDENFPLLKVVHCGHCGLRLYAHRSNSSRDRFYRCPPSEAGESRDCPGLMLKAETLEAHVFAALADFASSPLMGRLVGEEAEKLLASRQGELGEEIRQVEADLAKLDDKLHQWADAFTEGKLSEVQFHKVSRRWQGQYEELQARHQELTRRRERGSTDRQMMDRVRGALSTFSETFQSLPVSRQREILLQIIEHLTLEREEGGLLMRLKLRFLPAAEQLLPPGKGRPKAGLKSLSDRQLALLKLLDEGLSCGQIAAQWEVERSVPYALLWKARKQTGLADTQQLIQAAHSYIQAALPRLPLQGRVLPRRSGLHFPRRETQVMDLLVLGNTYEKVRQQLGFQRRSSVSVITLKVRRRLGVKTTQEAIAWWQENRDEDGAPKGCATHRHRERTNRA